MKTVRAIPIVVALAFGALGAPAADATRTTSITVVAQGLATPRGLIYDPAARRVLVAEAGVGGPSQQQGGTCAQPPEGALWCVGSSGAVFQYTERNGKSRRIAEGLPSIAFYDETGTTVLSVMGLHDLSLSQHGQLRVIFGLTGDPTLRAGLSPAGVGLGQLGRLRGDRLTLDADLAGFEYQHNPDQGPFTESNPYGMAASRLGTMVVDASGNDLLLVRPDGSIRTLAIFPPRAPAADPNDVIETVPTTVERGPDGAFYVGELTGFPFYKGEARVWRVVAGKAPTVFATGFSCIADLTFDERGRLVVLEMSKEGLNSPDDSRTGRLVRLERNGSRTDLATTGLNRPGGVAYAGNGTYYVTNFTSSANGSSQLLRIDVRH